MTIKDNVINNVLIDMTPHLNAENLRILEVSLAGELNDIELTRQETALSTNRDDNEYIVRLLYTRFVKDDLATGTLIQYMSTLKKLLEYTDKDIRDISDYDVIRFLSDYESGRYNGGRKVQATSYNGQRKYLSACFTKLRKMRIRPDNPVENVPQRKVVQKPVDHLDGIELECIRDYCETPRERALVEVFLSSAARISEIVAIEVKNIDWRTGRVLVYRTKNRDYHTIILGSAARYHLKKYLDSRGFDSPYAFASEKAPHGSLTVSGMRAIITRIKERIWEERRVYPHLFRKTAASTMHAKGAPLEIIQEKLGHSDPRTTVKYYVAKDPQRFYYENYKYAA